ncbi:MFS general substrate transporter [Atractiella rhizophila]|nr:MFS general substrate transporter [Atractiella rhizophila]
MDVEEVAIDVGVSGLGEKGKASYTQLPLEVSDEQDPESKYLTGIPLVLVSISLLLAIFLIALDQTIIAPALPVIVSRFNALEEIGWTSFAYFLTQTSFMLIAGTILNIFDRKWAFIWAVFIFSLGSLFCAVAWNVEFLIFGRAVSGVGAAGIFVGCLSMIAEVAKVEHRPLILGGFGAVFAISSVIGPLMGGAFTDHVSWRWCFYINLPVGVITIGSIFVLIKPATPAPLPTEVVNLTRSRFGWFLRIFGRFGTDPRSILFRLFALDLGGSLIMLGLVTCLLLPLQWGGNKYPWNDKIIIGLFAGAVGIIPVFILYEYKFAGPFRMLPFELFKQRTQMGASCAAFFSFWSLIFTIYYLPLYFQAVNGHSATRSGIDILPYMVGVVTFSAISGIAITLTGHYWFIIVCTPAFLCVGSGLLYTLKVDASNAELYGYQVLVAIGIGCVFQILILPVQAQVKDERDIPIATALYNFIQSLGAVIGLALANTLFSNKLTSGLHKFAPDAPFELVRNSVESIKTIDPALRPGVIEAYVYALDYTYLLGVGTGAGIIICSLFVKNINIKSKKPGIGAV